MCEVQHLTEPEVICFPGLLRTPAHSSLSFSQEEEPCFPVLSQHLTPLMRSRLPCPSHCDLVTWEMSLSLNGYSAWTGEMGEAGSAETDITRGNVEMWKCGSWGTGWFLNPQAPLSLRLWDLLTATPCPGVVLTATGWEEGRESGNQFTVSCGYLYAELTFFPLKCSNLKKIFSSAQTNCEIWVHRGGKKISDYPKCQMATGHLWGKAVLVDVLECSDVLEERTGALGIFGANLWMQGEAIYSSVPEPSPDPSDPKLATWGCVFILMRIHLFLTAAEFRPMYTGYLYFLFFPFPPLNPNPISSSCSSGYCFPLQASVL